MSASLGISVGRSVGRWVGSMFGYQKKLHMDGEGKNARTKVVATINKQLNNFVFHIILLIALTFYS